MSSRLVFTRIPRAILSTRGLKPINVRYFSATQSLLNEVDTKKLIMQMRKETSLPLKNCREALVETVWTRLYIFINWLLIIKNWDFEAAKLYLKKEAKRLGLKKMASLGKINVWRPTSNCSLVRGLILKRLQIGLTVLYGETYY